MHAGYWGRSDARLQGANHFPGARITVAQLAALVATGRAQGVTLVETLHSGVWIEDHFGTIQAVYQQYRPWTLCAGYAPRMERIVVGIDGSESAGDALRWAVAQAKLTGAIVEAVYAWDPGVVASLGIPPMVDWQPLREAAQARPGEIVEETVGSDTGVRIVTKTVMGHAAAVLVERSAKADLLVVGSRGLGGLKGMVLGSVGHHCAAHAHCPVVIVHSSAQPKPHVPERRPLEQSSE